MRRLLIALATVALLVASMPAAVTARPTYTLSWMQVMAVSSAPPCEVRVRVGVTSTGKGWRVGRITWHDVTADSSQSFDLSPQYKTGTFEFNYMFNATGNHQIDTLHHVWEWSATMIGGGGKVVAGPIVAVPTYQFPETETCPAGGAILATYGTVPAG